MSQTQMLEALKAGQVAEVIAALEAAEAAYEEWVEEEQSWAVARELNSSPELLEAVPW